MLKRIIRAQKYGRMANAYDYFGPDEEEIAMMVSAGEHLSGVQYCRRKSYNTATNNKGIAIAKTR